MSDRRTARRVLGFGAAGATALALVLGTGLGQSSAGAAGADVGTAGSGVTVNGLGSVQGAPDVMRVQMAVTRRAEDVRTAVEAVNASAKRIRAALAKRGVAASDVATADFSVLTPYDERSSTPSYEATHSLAITLRNLASAGQVVADAAAAGGNDTRIYSMAYDIADRAALLAKARDAAFADARAKAESYARLSGRTLGAVRSVQEGSGDYGYYDPYGGNSMLAGLSAPSAVPVAPGTRTVSVATTVAWDLL